MGYPIVTGFPIRLWVVLFDVGTSPRVVTTLDEVKGNLATKDFLPTRDLNTKAEGNTLAYNRNTAKDASVAKTYWMLFTGYNEEEKNLNHRRQH